MHTQTHTDTQWYTQTHTHILPYGQMFTKVHSDFLTDWLIDGLTLLYGLFSLTVQYLIIKKKELFECKKKEPLLNSVRCYVAISRSDPLECSGWQSAARGRQPQASITSQRNKTFKDFHEVKKQVREFIHHVPYQRKTIRMKSNPFFSCHCTDEWLWARYRPREVGLCAAQRFIFWCFKVPWV